MRVKTPGAVLAFAALAVSGAQAVPADAAAGAGKVPANAPRQQLYQPPLAFEENRGQSDPAVRYLARGRGSTLFLTGSESVLSLRANGRNAVLRTRLLGGAAAAEVSAEQPLPGKVNVLRGSDSSRWQRGMPTFGRVVREAYPGIDLVYHGKEGRLEYDFVVAPGADPTQIRMQIAGAKRVSLNATGDLLLETPAGTVRHQRPVLYQEESGKRRAVPGTFVLAPEKPGATAEVSFRVGTYDRTRPLVIDPIIWYSTYLGGAGGDAANAVAVQADGTTVVAGSTLSANFPRVGGTQGAAGATDAFVTKYGPTTAAGETPVILFSTYLGGAADDVATGVALDSAGRIYVAGSTGSLNFPVLNAFQSTFRGGSVEFPTDAFVTELEATGDALSYSTYLGGTGNDNGAAIAVPAPGVVLTTGFTNSTNFPTKSPGGTVPFQTDQPATDAFVSRLLTTSVGAASLSSSTYVGGAGFDLGNGIAVDPSGDVFVTGNTTSVNFPTSAGAFRTTDPDVTRNTGGTVISNFGDVFVIRLSANLTVRRYATYLGGQADDFGNAIAVDAAGNAVVVGRTLSSNFPRSKAVDSTFVGAEAFITRLKSNGSGLDYSTFLGGSGLDAALAVALDPTADKLVWVTGSTTSTNFPLTLPTQSVNKGLKDAFIAELEFIPSIEGGQQVFLDFSTYAGGAADDEGRGIAVDGTARPYAVGVTASVDNPATRTRNEGFPLKAASQVAFGGSTDAFVLKVGNVPPRGDDSGRMHVNPTELNFGTVKIGKSRTKVVRIRNTADSLLTGQVGEVEAPFKIVAGGGEFQINPGDELKVRVRFKPTSKPKTKGLLSIAGSDNKNPRVSIRLSGKGKK